MHRNPYHNSNSNSTHISPRGQISSPHVHNIHSYRDHNNNKNDDDNMKLENNLQHIPKTPRLSYINPNINMNYIYRNDNIENEEKEEKKENLYDDGPIYEINDTNEQYLQFYNNENTNIDTTTNNNNNIADSKLFNKSPKAIENEMNRGNYILYIYIYYLDEIHCIIANIYIYIL